MSRKDAVQTKTTLAAPPEKVWEGLMFYEQLPGRPPLLLRLLLPVPLRTSGRKSRPGETVICVYEGGHILKRLTDVVPSRRYAFSVIEQNLPIAGITLGQGRYDLAAVPGGTEVTLTTEYSSRWFPAWLFHPIETYVCRSFHRYILEAMRVALDTRGVFVAPLR